MLIVKHSDESGRTCVPYWTYEHGFSIILLMDHPRLMERTYFLLLTKTRICTESHKSALRIVAVQPVTVPTDLQNCQA